MDKENLLLSACRDRLEELVKKLLDDNVDIESTNIYGTTPLIIATATSNDKLIRVLLEQGADVNHADRENQTPLFYACMTCNYQIAKLFLDIGADPDITTSSNLTPLYPAFAGSNNTELISLLIHRGVNPYHKNDNGKDFIDYNYSSSDEEKNNMRKYVQSIFPGNSIKPALRK